MLLFKGVMSSIFVRCPFVSKFILEFEFFSSLYFLLLHFFQGIFLSIMSFLLHFLIFLIVTTTSLIWRSSTSIDILSLRVISLRRRIHGGFGSPPPSNIVVGMEAPPWLWLNLPSFRFKPNESVNKNIFNQDGTSQVSSSTLKEKQNDKFSRS